MSEWIEVERVQCRCGAMELSEWGEVELGAVELSIVQSNTM